MLPSREPEVCSHTRFCALRSHGISQPGGLLRLVLLNRQLLQLCASVDLDLGDPAAHFPLYSCLRFCALMCVPMAISIAVAHHDYRSIRLSDPVAAMFVSFQGIQPEEKCLASYVAGVTNKTLSLRILSNVFFSWDLADLISATLHAPRSTLVRSLCPPPPPEGPSPRHRRVPGRHELADANLALRPLCRFPSFAPRS